MDGQPVAGFIRYHASKALVVLQGLLLISIYAGVMKRLIRIAQCIILTLVLAMWTPFSTLSVSAEDTGVVNSRFLSDINALRASKGLGALSMDSGLVGVAKVRAQEASTTWSHTRPNGTQGISMLPSNKWRGENLSYVQYGTFTFTQSEQEAAESLMFENLKASPTHYANMVHTNFTKIGIYTYVSQSGTGYRLTTAFMFTN